MDNTTMTMNAVTCVASVRPRVAGPVRLADALRTDQGITVSTAALAGGRVAGFGAPVMGEVSISALTFVATYKTPDVVRSRSGRPPV